MPVRWVERSKTYLTPEIKNFRLIDRHLAQNHQINQWDKSRVALMMEQRRRQPYRLGPINYHFTTLDPPLKV